MSTYSYSDIFQTTSGQALNGISVTAWKASRFTSAPAYGDDTPSGDPDAATTTGQASGSAAGSFTLQLPTAEPYYVACSYDGVNSWKLVNSAQWVDGTSGAEAQLNPPIAVGGSGGAATTAVQNSFLPAANIDAGGPYAVPVSVAGPAYLQCPTSPFAPLPNGNRVIFYSYGPSANPGNGTLNIYHVIIDPLGNVVDGPIEDIQDLSNGSTPLSLWQSYATILADGRLLLVYQTIGFVQSGSSYIFEGMNGTNGFVNPDGKDGNIRYALASIEGNNINWELDSNDNVNQMTLVTGFSAADGFDYTGIQRPWEAETGSIVFCVNGSSTYNGHPWVAGPTAPGTYAVGYVVGTYDPNEAITWGTISDGTTFPLPTGATATDCSTSGTTLTVGGSITGTISTNDGVGITSGTGTFADLTYVTAVSGDTITLSEAPSVDLSSATVQFGTFNFNENSIAPIYSAGEFQDSLCVHWRNNGQTGGGAAPLQSIATGTIADLLNGTLSFGTPSTPVDAGGNNLASGVDQEQTWDTESGVIYYLTRSIGWNPGNPGGSPLFFSSNNGGTYWSEQMSDISFGSSTGNYLDAFWYGCCCPIGNGAFMTIAANQVDSTGATYEIRIHWGSIGGAFLPNGSVVAQSVGAGFGSFANGIMAGYLRFPGYGRNPHGVWPLVAPSNNTIGALQPIASVETPISNYGGNGQPIFADYAPPLQYGTMRTASSVYWQNFTPPPTNDPGVVFTTGVLYLFLMSPPPQESCGAVYMETGADAGSDDCVAYVGLYTAPGNTAAANIVKGSEVSSLPASTIIEFPMALTAISTPTGNPTGSSTNPWQIYVGLLHVGTTAPSWLGNPVTAARNNVLPYLVGTYGSSLTALPTTITSSPGIASAGATTVPFMEFAT